MMIRIIVALLFVASVAAMPPLPTTFFGDVIVNGESAPVGTVVSGWVGDTKYIEFVVGSYDHEVGRYTLDFPGDDPDTQNLEGAREGEIVTFKVDGTVAEQTGVWHEAQGFVNVDISISGQSPSRGGSGPQSAAAPTAMSEPELEKSPVSEEEQPILATEPDTEAAAQTTLIKHDASPEKVDEQTSEKSLAEVIIIAVVVIAIAGLSSYFILRHKFRR